jgi:hypothetical protein
MAVNEGVGETPSELVLFADDGMDEQGHKQRPYLRSCEDSIPTLRYCIF